MNNLDNALPRYYTNWRNLWKSLWRNCAQFFIFQKNTCGTKKRLNKSLSCFFSHFLAVLKTLGTGDNSFFLVPMANSWLDKVRKNDP